MVHTINSLSAFYHTWQVWNKATLRVSARTYASYLSHTGLTHERQRSASRGLNSIQRRKDRRAFKFLMSPIPN